MPSYVADPTSPPGGPPCRAASESRERDPLTSASSPPRPPRTGGSTTRRTAWICPSSRRPGRRRPRTCVGARAPRISRSNLLPFETCRLPVHGSDRSPTRAGSRTLALARQTTVLTAPRRRPRLGGGVPPTRHDDAPYAGPPRSRRPLEDSAPAPLIQLMVPSSELDRTDLIPVYPCIDLSGLPLPPPEPLLVLGDYGARRSRNPFTCCRSRCYLFRSCCYRSSRHP